MFICAEYIWLDGSEPTKKLRSKTRVLDLNKNGNTQVSDFPEWGFDGSSTSQAPGDNSDLVLKPVSFFHDPIRGEGNFLVLCEVFNEDNTPHVSNTRAQLRHWMDNGGRNHDAWMGFEQEYTLFYDQRPLGWPKNGFPPPQGPFYCGVGADRIYGRGLVEEHTALCIKAGVMIYGTNAEVMPGQWEFQIGFRGVANESPDPLNVSDHLWVARWLIGRVAEEHKVVVNFENKPVKGDWNGAGNHTNFSTSSMRDKKTGWDAINNYVKALEKTHAEHVAVYGHGLADRLTGLHETCDISTFRAGARDRGASIRIPNSVAQERCGYIEDRRPGANCDPYEVSARLMQTLIESEKGSKKSKTSSSEMHT